MEKNNKFPGVHPSWWEGAPGEHQSYLGISQKGYDFALAESGHIFDNAGKCTRCAGFESCMTFQGGQHVIRFTPCEGENGPNRRVQAAKAHFSFLGWSGAFEMISCPEGRAHTALVPMTGTWNHGFCADCAGEISLRT